MLDKVSLVRTNAINTFKNQNQKNVSNSIAGIKQVENYKPQNIGKLLSAYQAYNNISFASSLSFGSSLASAFNELNMSMVTCDDPERNIRGEEVGSRVDVTKLVSEFQDDLPRYDDAIKTTIEVARDEKKKKEGIIMVNDARVQVKKGSGDKMKFEITKRPARNILTTKPGVTKDFLQNIAIQIEPYDIAIGEDGKRYITGTQESAYVLNTKGNIMAVIEDGNNVLLTNTGELHKKDQKSGHLDIKARKFEEEYDEEGKKITYENIYQPFAVYKVPPVREHIGGSFGEGTELIIGLEKGRFVNEIIESIEEFERKINSGEITLEPFVPAPNVKNIQIGMLAGGFGSRAEYANASSSKIMHGKKDGSNLTKGCFRTATGLTPMETSFISLHKAGYLDCSKGNFGIGKNIKFYLNDSGKNGGNGSFSVDLYNTMEREGRKSLLILPNDAMSRIPQALKDINEKINSGEAAMVMVAKEVRQKDALHKLGIMKITPEGLIEKFAEKPPVIEEGYADNNGNCFANTFQFAVSKEAFEVLNMLEDTLKGFDAVKGRESRDWSKTYTPILMGITQNDKPEDMQAQILKEAKVKIPLEQLAEAKRILGNQKIYAIKSNEPWADCGTLNALYDTTIQIAMGAFPLEDFERAHVLDSVNTETGLVASSPEQKKEIEEKYVIKGQVMAVPKAKPADADVMIRNKDAITTYTSKH